MNILEYERMACYVRGVLVHNRMVYRTGRDAAQYFINLWTAIRSPLRKVSKNDIDFLLLESCSSVAFALFIDLWHRDLFDADISL
jgi:hypothetical protein